MPNAKFNYGDVEHVWYQDSDVAGPTALILGGIHGDEQAGISVINRLVSGEFKVPLERGRLIVALGNKAAIDANVRFIDTNLNREFRTLSHEETEQQERSPSLEVARATELKPVLDEADAALDMHGFRAHDGDPFIITEERGFEAARAIGAPYISSGWTTIEAGGTDSYMEEQGKIGICYELAQLADLKRGIPRGEAGVLRFLEHMQLIEMVRDRGQDSERIAPQFVHATNAVLAEPGFTWGQGFPYRSFQSLPSGEVVAQNGPTADSIIRVGEKQVIIFPSDDPRPKPGDEMFNLGTIIDPPRQ